MGTSQLPTATLATYANGQIDMLQGCLRITVTLKRERRIEEVYSSNRQRPAQARARVTLLSSIDLQNKFWQAYVVLKRTRRHCRMFID